MTPHKSYKVGRAGVILGVFDEPEMVYMINCGKVLKTDDYWTEGMPAWQKVSTKVTWKISGAPPASNPEKKDQASRQVSDSDSRKSPSNGRIMISYADQLPDFRTEEERKRDEQLSALSDALVGPWLNRSNDTSKDATWVEHLRRGFAPTENRMIKERNLVTAYAWWSISGIWGNSIHPDMRAEVKKCLTTAQLHAADALANAIVKQLEEGQRRDKK